jgi:uncharacterized tellurite resistance protein B-like protein
MISNASNYLQNLIYFAAIDSSLDEREKDFIRTAGKRIGISPADIEYALENPETSKPEFPSNEVVRFLLLDDLFKLMAVDGRLHSAEIEQLEKHASNLGFETAIISEMNEVLVRHKQDGFLNNHIPSLSSSGILSIDKIKKKP